MIERRCGAMAKIMPGEQRADHRAHAPRHHDGEPHDADERVERLGCVALPTTVAYSAPPRPATNALTPKSTSFARTMLMPLVVDAGSLERMAANTSPDVARFRFTIANATIANTTATIAYISRRSVMPIPNGRGDLQAGAEVVVLGAGPHELLDRAARSRW